MNADKDGSEIEFDKIIKLVDELGQSKDPASQQLSEVVKQGHETNIKLAKSIQVLQESLDYLRICVKYQTFDLEATRRENEYLRRLLEDQNNSG